MMKGVWVQPPEPRFNIKKFSLKSEKFRIFKKPRQASRRALEIELKDATGEFLALPTLNFYKN